jgi:hypothetical protein
VRGLLLNLEQSNAHCTERESGHVKPILVHFAGIFSYFFQFASFVSFADIEPCFCSQNLGLNDVSSEPLVIQVAKLKYNHSKLINSQFRDPDA